MTVGFNQPLYILPFDRRGTFEARMFGWKGTLTAEQTAQITAVKQVIYDGFKAALTDGVPARKADVLVGYREWVDIFKKAATTRPVTVARRTPKPLTVDCTPGRGKLHRRADENRRRQTACEPP
jgi:hypothetical protein